MVFFLLLTCKESFYYFILITFSLFFVQIIFIRLKHFRHIGYFSVRIQ